MFILPILVERAIKRRIFLISDALSDAEFGRQQLTDAVLVVMTLCSSVVVARHFSGADSLSLSRLGVPVDFFQD